VLHEPSPGASLLVPQNVSLKVNIRGRYWTSSRMPCSRGRV